MPPIRQPARAPASAQPVTAAPKPAPAPVSAAAALQRRIGNAGMRQLVAGQRAARPAAGGDHAKSEAAAAPAPGKAGRPKPGHGRPAPGAQDAGAEKAKPTAPETGEGGGGEKAPAATVVQLHMPEPPSGPSPASRNRLKAVQTRAGGKAAAHAALPGGGAQVGDARKAVTPPTAEAEAAAQAALIAQVQAAPSPEIVKLCERIREVIRNKRPPDEDALMEAKPDEAATDAGNQLNATVDSEAKKVQSNYGAMNAAADPAAPPKAPGIPPQPNVAATPAVNAQAATPDAVPAAAVSLDKDAAETKAKAQAAGMDTAPAQLVQSGPVAEARAAQGELDQVAKESPAEVLAKQKQALGRAEAGMASLGAQALAALTASREGATGANQTRQQSMVGSEESMRAKAGADAKQAFDEAKAAVDGLLNGLPEKAMDEWNAAKDVLVSNFKADLAEVQKEIDDRHAGVGGFFVGLWDAVTGLPSWAEKAYSRAENNFANGVIEKLTAISTKVNAVIAACDLIIKGARDKIAKIFSALPESLRGWAAQEQANFDGQLDKLHDQAIAARDGFNKNLKESASAAVDEVRAEIAELRKKAGGLVGRIVAAVGRFLDDPVKFIIEGLLELLGIPPAAFWAVVAKIKKVVKDIAADPLGFADNLLKGLAKGFGQFFDNFGEHMIRGFLSWLFGDLKGVQVPKDVSLKSVITFFLQLMGITWPNIRKILVDKIGAKNVALIEKAYSLISLLMEKGPEGIYEMIKEALNPQSIVDQVVEMAVEYMVTAIAKQVAARLLLLFNPVGAIVQALEAIYRVLKWIFQNAAKIFSLVETVVNGIADIVAGNVGGFATAVETALEKLIAPVIGFIADYFSLGDLPSVVAAKIKAMQKWILGHIETAIGWIIDKGKALLAAVGIGKKDDGKKGKNEVSIGEEIPFDADGEAHRLWIDVVGERATLMVASKEQTVSSYLASIVKKGGPLAEKAKIAKGLADRADIKADELAKIAAKPEDKGAAAPGGPITKNQEALKEDEQKLVDLLREIFQANKPIEPYFGTPVDAIDPKQTPLGYDIWTDKGAYEYGGDYDYLQIQRAGGYGSAKESEFPKVHVDDGGLIQKNANILRSDREVIRAYLSEIAAVEAKLEDDEAPKLEGGPKGPANMLDKGANRDRSFNRGIRKQMEAIVKAIRDKVEITGVEVKVGQKRIDYTARILVGDKKVHALVEYKHWTGKLSAKRRVELRDKLKIQLEGQIYGGKGRFAALRLDWPSFHTLDDDSIAVFETAFGEIADTAQKNGMQFIRNTG